MIKQVMLPMKDIWDNNGRSGIVYDFVATWSALENGEV